MLTKKLILILLTSCFFVSCNNSNETISTTDSSTMVNLPDGSSALLNNNSSIEYNKQFEVRTVKQTGEVYYIVVEGSSPFIVETERGSVEVLGTEFNVNSNDDQLEVEVEEGTVRLKLDKLSKDIKKGQKALFKDIKNGIKVGKAEFKHKQWTKKFDKDLKKLGKKIKKGSVEVKKETNKIGKDIKKKIKKDNK